MERSLMTGTDIKVLYVEDDPLARDLLTTMITIRFPGISVINAENGEQGLQLYRDHNPDIVLTDIHMPQMDGVRMSEKIKAGNPEAVIIIITAHNDTAHLLRAIDLGIDRYILKPIDKFKLFDSMENAILNVTMEKLLNEKQKQLTEMTERLNAVIESNGDAIYIKDLEGRYLQINTATALMIGKTVEEIIGRDDATLLPPETAAEQRRNDLLVINGGNVINFEETLLDRHGETAVFLVTKGPLHDDQGNINATFGVTRNITEQKRYEEQIEKQNAELEKRVQERTLDLEQSNKEMEAFCHAISHELRAPIARMEGFRQAAGECIEARDYRDVQYYLERLGCSTEQLKTAVDALLMMNRLNKTEISPEPVNLTYLSQQVMIDLMEDYGNQTIHFSNKPEVTVNGDLKLLSLCMKNLFSNALKYSSKKEESLITFGSEQQEGQTVYFVSDNGAGFDMAYAGNLFKPFSRLHHPSEFEGTGIGLATVQCIVEKHNGRIWVESRLNEGTTFFFTLANYCSYPLPTGRRG